MGCAHLGRKSRETVGLAPRLRQQGHSDVGVPTLCWRRQHPAVPVFQGRTIPATKTSVFGSGSESSVFGSGSESSVFGSGSESSVFGSGSESSVFGSGSESSVFGSGSESSVFGSGSESGRDVLLQWSHPRLHPRKCHPLYPDHHHFLMRVRAGASCAKR